MKIYLSMNIGDDQEDDWLYRSLEVSILPQPGQWLDFSDNPDLSNIFSTAVIDRNSSPPTLHAPHSGAEPYLTAFCVPSGDVWRYHDKQTILAEYQKIGWSLTDPWKQD